MIQLSNSLTNKKDSFEPIDKSNIKMYVCGPTVYDKIHIGNARSIVVYDFIYRCLKTLYPKVTYVRNITDIDDKIIKRAKDLEITEKELTQKTIEDFHKDCEYLKCLKPNVEPKATDHIEDIKNMIENIVKNGHGYVVEGDVYFDVSSFADYGKLSNRKQEDLLSGTRVETDSKKKNPSDFILWKETSHGVAFDSPCTLKTQGRPGWHIECSAMSTKHLGQDFDIHGGGADLTFPHHENEIAQSCCANVCSSYAKYWVHNGFLKINGEKMSKSLGNFITVDDIKKKGIDGRVLRYCLLMTQYKKPLDFSDKLLEDAAKSIKKIDNILNNYKETIEKIEVNSSNIPEDTKKAICDDFNTLKIFASLHGMIKKIKKSENEEVLKESLSAFVASLDLMGLLPEWL